MCGIFGLWNFESARGEHLHEASHLLRHRGPDDEGILIFNHQGASRFSGSDTKAGDHPKLPPDEPCANVLLHRRLAIIDLSDAGHQPMSLDERRLHLVFNGEIYNFKELIRAYQLEPKTDSDSEVILLLYRKIGVEAFSKFRGMWAFALLDLEKNELLLCRDRFGIKPLYFLQKNDGLAFSSEVKPLLSLPNVKAEWPLDKILQFLVYGATSDPFETFFEGVLPVKPGTFLRFDLANLHQHEGRFYQLRESVLAGDASWGSFADRFGESLSEHLIADVEIGSCLSGGLDSSLIVAEASKHAPGKFKTFTCSFPGEAIDEASYARMLDRDGNLEQHFATPTASDFMSQFDALVLAQERPFGSASIFAQYAVMELAGSRGVKVLLDGQGADEILGGYYPFAGAYLVSLLRKGKLRKYKKEIKALKSNFNPNMGTAMLRAAFYGLPQNFQSMTRQKGRLGYELISEKYKARAAILESPQRGATDFQELGLRSVEFGLYELLHYEDRNAMHFSIESRVPFLDHRVVEWSLAQAPEVKIVNGWTKYPIRQMLDKESYKELAWRKDKLGFVAPQARWRDELRNEMVALIDRIDLPEVFDKVALRNLFLQKLNKPAEQTEFWRVFALLRWLELFKITLI